MKDSTLITVGKSPLTVIESSRLLELETIVDANLSSFISAGVALTEIHDRKLYRDANGTFEGYVRVRFQIERRHAYRLMDAAAVVANVSNLDTRPPTHESQVRQIASLPASEQREAWREASATAPKGKITASHVAKVIAKRKPQVIEQGVIGDVDDDDSLTSTDATGKPIEQEKVRAAFAEVPKFREVGNLIIELKRQAKELANGPGGAHLDVGEIEKACNALRSNILGGIPHAACRYCPGTGCKECKQTGYHSKYEFDTQVSKELM